MVIGNLGAINKNCHEDLDCKITRNAVCSKDKVCECRSNYVQVSYSRCAPLLDEFCEENDKCAVTNSICVSHQCTCDTNYLQQSNNQCQPSKNIEKRCAKRGTSQVLLRKNIFLNVS